VRAAIPPERLLVFDVSEGWQPLCRFLDVAMPATPFPRLNSTEEWWRRVKGEPH
jgi:Sulfotransferase domain